MSTVLVTIMLLCSMAGSAKAAAIASTDLTELSLEELMNIEITSVSKKPERLADAVAAIFVISQDDIRRSGVTSIPEALRMVPGINVARIDSNKWAITSRGFNGRFANNLLVLIDGRIVYTPSCSGVYWEVQDTLMEDVDRIEVIRGPGATLWGANAVNGVINIITKSVADTQGGLVAIGTGTEELGFGGVRYGTVMGEATYGRFYAKGFKRDEFVHTTGDDAGDDWNMLRGGFRLDSLLYGHAPVTVQGDIYQGNINQTLNLATLSVPFSQTFEDKSEVSGWNLLTHWQHTLSPTSDFTLQIYYDRTDRDDAVYGEIRDTFDINFQHQFAAGERHDVIWGLGYRYTHDDFSNSGTFSLDPDSRNDELFSAFLQDKITLIKNCLWLTIGSKFEHNDYTGFEIQPNGRLFWAPYPKHKLWAAVSRAVRTPARFEHDVRVLNLVLPPFSPNNPNSFPIALTVMGDPDYESEELLAYELGYRFVPANALSIDLAIFYNDYDNLRRSEMETRVFQDIYMEQPLRFDNGLKGKTYGLELAAVWQAADWWRWDIAYSYLRIDIDTRFEKDNIQNSDGPQHQASLRSAVKLSKDLDLDFWLRYVDDVKAVIVKSQSRLEIDSYFTLDIRLAWQLNDNVEIALVGQNLLDDKHPEYVHENFTLPTEVERGMYGKVTWQF
ncbi:MAG: TonB-dependent receptor [Desulfobacteraceae bacterium]|nr:TonB-dependent receptor [Desulfobacteraceae bacterium]MBC2720101.1 TonB-dependent receptor [Desulfobacteraceae bacterium]